eukprot:scaffold2797_cov112-Isochrysis_galbana.AAC.1
MQLDRDEGRGLSRSRVARTGTGRRGACVNGIAYVPPDNRRPPALLTKENENNPTGRLPRNRLPDGQMCASGTCPFKHKGDCWRDPRKKVTLPSAMSEATRTTIKEARAENAKRLKVTAQPCLIGDRGDERDQDKDKRQRRPSPPTAGAVLDLHGADRVSADGLGNAGVDAFGFAGMAMTTDTSEKDYDSEADYYACRGGGDRGLGEIGESEC